MKLTLSIDSWLFLGFSVIANYFPPCLCRQYIILKGGNQLKEIIARYKDSYIIGRCVGRSYYINIVGRSISL